MRTLRTSSESTRRRAGITARPSRFPGLKRMLVRRLACQWRTIVPVSLIRRAVNEAEEMAQTTGFPGLFFPELAVEQVRRVTAFAAPNAEPADCAGGRWKRPLTTF